MMSNGVKSQLHRSMHIAAEDAAVYSRLDGTVVTEKQPEVVIETVIRETESLWKKYKAQKKKKGKRTAKVVPIKKAA
jgi:hypothetical protein